MPDDGDTVGQGLRFGQVMRRNQEGAFTVLEFDDGIADLFGALRVHRRGRLVQQQHRRIMQHGAHQGQLLLHAFGVLAQALVERVFQAKALHQAQRPRYALLRAEVIDAPEEVEIFQRLHALVEAVLLGQDADMRPHLLRLFDHIITGNRRPA